MEFHYTKLIESTFVVVTFLVLKIAVNYLISRTVVDKVIQKSRSQLIKNTINLIGLLVCFSILMVIWGVKQSEIVVFVSSILTIIGVAFFAQWSLLSNVTSSIIIFFGHPVKIGDTIVLMEAKDYEIRGEVISIGLFFTKIKTIDAEDELTLPNNMFIQKTIRKINGPVAAPINGETVDAEIQTPG